MKKMTQLQLLQSPRFQLSNLISRHLLVLSMNLRPKIWTTPFCGSNRTSSSSLVLVIHNLPALFARRSLYNDELLIQIIAHRRNKFEIMQQNTREYTRTYSSHHEYLSLMKD